MIENILWLFPAYRRAQARIAVLEQALAALERQPASAVSEMLKDFQDNVLSDRPFDGRIPDSVWLTPGDDDRSERAEA